MKEIELTQGKVAIVDDENYKLLNQSKWYALLGGSGYRAARKGKFYYENGKQIQPVILMHRLIMDTPDGIDVDHINHNTLDNRKSNLRNCLHSENSSNRKKNRTNRSKYKGVILRGGYILAKIAKDKKQIHLGYHKTEEEAAKAYNKAALNLFGEFAKLNTMEAG